MLTVILGLGALRHPAVLALSTLFLTIPVLDKLSSDFLLRSYAQPREGLCISCVSHSASALANHIVPSMAKEFTNSSRRIGFVSFSLYETLHVHQDTHPPTWEELRMIPRHKSTEYQLHCWEVMTLICGGSDRTMGGFPQGLADVQTLVG